MVNLEGKHVRVSCRGGQVIWGRVVFYKGGILYLEQLAYLKDCSTGSVRWTFRTEAGEVTDLITAHHINSIHIFPAEER